MLKIYHNPRCGKSREAVEILKESGKEFEIVPYTKNILSISELKNIIKSLSINPIDLVRKNEIIWKNTYKNTVMSDEEIIIAMHKNPKLIERPIVISGNKAVIGRPPTEIKKII